MRKTLAVLLLLALPLPAFAWNAKGHMVVARLAWRQLTDGQRLQVSALLKKHPHYAVYLAAQRPEGFTEEEWAFMRAATWADWIKGGQGRDYNHPTWHYIDIPFVPPGSAVDAAKHQPPPDQENAVWAFARSVDKIRNGSDEEKAVGLTWIFHLVGDIHQPLHCTEMFSERFPEGDRGGNSCLIRIRTSPTNLHSFWDGLLGNGTNAGEIGKDVYEIEAVMKDKADEVRKEIDAHATFESWAREGFELAKRVVYLNGELKVAAGGGRRESNDNVPQAPDDYAPNSGKVARVQIGKGGIRLADQLKTLFP
jgi:hypothetical protein